jgi:hypothetical protein
MMIAPYMPLPMWCSTGGVPQWYMNTPGKVDFLVKLRPPGAQLTLLNCATRSTRVNR